jgi:uncharacterized protein
MNEPARKFLPGLHPIDGYGSGGFRFAGMSHHGSILALPSGLSAWAAVEPRDIDAAALAPVLGAPPGSIELLLLGTGTDIIFVPKALRMRLKAIGIVTEAMATAPAVRTYNILLGEGRRVAAALLAVA